MDMDAAIGHILDGNAVLFAGAGCSDGAINIRNKNFLRSSDFAKLLAEKAGLKEVPPLEDAAEAFVDAHGQNALIAEVKAEFTTKILTDHHIEIGSLPWKRVYTTNYDDVLEQAYAQNSKKLQPVTMRHDPFQLPKGQTLCIHFNGYVNNLDLDTIDTDLKLTDTSFITSAIAASPWAVIFRQDVRFARAVLFIGYSLHDLDIRRILLEIPQLRDKCVFVLGRSPDSSSIRRAQKFGNSYNISVAEFCTQVKKNRRTYVPTDIPYLSTLSIREHLPPKTRANITDRAFTELLLYGTHHQAMLSDSFHSGRRYLLQRSKQTQLFKHIDSGHRVVIVCSDLGNGKTLFLHGTRLEALEQGFRVFEVRQHNEQAASELEAIARLDENALVTIEEYQDWIPEIARFLTFSVGSTTLVLTARNSLHDIASDNLVRSTGLQSIPEVHLDILEDEEIEWFSDAFDEYGLWCRIQVKADPYST